MLKQKVFFLFYSLKFVHIDRFLCNQVSGAIYNLLYSVSNMSHIRYGNFLSSPGRSYSFFFVQFLTDTCFSSW